MALTTVNFGFADSDLMQASGPVAPATTWLIGSNVSTNGNHGLLSFTDAGWAALAALEDGAVKTATFYTKTSVGNTPTCDIVVYGASFTTPASIVAGDYGKVANTQIAKTDDDYRVKLGVLYPAGVAVGSGVSSDIRIPSFLFSKSSHVMLQIRPDVVGVPGANDAVTIHSPTAASTADRPTLTVEYGTLADIDDPESGFYTLQTGADSFIAFGLEGNPGVAVKPNLILEAVEMDLQPRPSNIMSPARNRSRIMPSRMAVGRVRPMGSATIVVTPGVWFPLLRSQYKLVSTTDEGLISGVQVYEHTFEVAKAKDTLTMTVLMKRGDFYEIYAGTRVANMNWAFAQDDAVQLSFDMMAKSYYMYDENSAGGPSLEYIMASDAQEDDPDNEFFSFINTYATVDGDEKIAECTRTINLGIGQNVYEKTGFSRRRSVQGHYVGAASASISIESYFESDRALRNALGLKVHEYPLAPNRELIYNDWQIKLNSPKYYDLDQQIQGITISMPRVMFGDNTVDNPRDAAIMVIQNGAALIEESTGTNVQVIVRCQHPASFFDPQTELITVLPKES